MPLDLIQFKQRNGATAGVEISSKKSIEIARWGSKSLPKLAPAAHLSDKHHQVASILQSRGAQAEGAVKTHFVRFKFSTSATGRDTEYNKQNMHFVLSKSRRSGQEGDEGVLKIYFVTPDNLTKDEVTKGGPFVTSSK